MKVFIQVCTFPFLVEYDMGVIALRYPQIDFQVESPKKEMITFTSHKFPTPRMFPPKRQWDMMTSLPSDSTQKTLSNDTHIIYFQKWQLLIMPSDASVIGAMWKYWESTFKMMIPISYISKKGSFDDAIRCLCHMYCVTIRSLWSNSLVVRKVWHHLKVIFISFTKYHKVSYCHFGYV